MKPAGVADLLFRFEGLRDQYNRRCYVSPDPLQFVLECGHVADREVVAFVASALAFGNVKQILRSIQTVLDRMGEPARYVTTTSRSAMRRDFAGFRHRFVGGDELADVMHALGRLIDRDGSLGATFAAGLRTEEVDVVDALSRFVEAIRSKCEDRRSYLAPSPDDGSACKRLNLFLRWMVRADDVDPGGWDVSPAKLVVPLDTHMHRIALALGLTQRRQANLRTAREITDAFRRCAPEDPVRYDFALTRLGIRTDTDLDGFLKSCRGDAGNRRSTLVVE